MDETMSTELSALDLHLFAEGTHSRLSDKLGSHVRDGSTRFAVWAPNAEAVSVVGSWNDWDGGADPLRRRDDASGIWEGSSDTARAGDTYKYRVHSNNRGYVADKADPFGFASEVAPATASRICDLDHGHEWHDAAWLARRAGTAGDPAPMSIYELHFGSWQRRDGALPTYRDIAAPLGEYVKAMGFTHVELMPLAEHPFYGSWGYQTTGYFAATSRYGEPADLMHLVDHLHGLGLGVILDWVPSHFPTDEHGLQYFDGTHLFEHEDPRQGFHPEWNSSIFNYGRNEVRSFLVSSAVFWLDKYHFDGLRVDGVASMLYLDYARKSGEWIPNRHGGNENLDATVFLRALNDAVDRFFPDVVTIAEESTAWPGVSRPTSAGGLGFAMKWNMGWMHDTLAFFEHEPVHRRYHLDALTFSLVYAFDENFVLPMSHDEVVHGKGSLLNKMPGDAWQRLANLRLLYALMWAHPGKKLLFMGGELAQEREWTHEGQLQWELLQSPAHAGVQRLVADLNRLYVAAPALHEQDFAGAGFEWIEAHDQERTVIAFIRKARNGSAPVVVVCNLTPVPREHYRLGVPAAGRWHEILNSDADVYGGSGIGNLGGADTAPLHSHGRPQSLSLRLPPLGAVYLCQSRTTQEPA
jgi:1,4-alpha-glucan branching enzyme